MRRKLATASCTEYVVFDFRRKRRSPGAGAQLVCKILGGVHGHRGGPASAARRKKSEQLSERIRCVGCTLRAMGRKLLQRLAQRFVQRWVEIFVRPRPQGFEDQLGRSLGIEDEHGGL
jgi:hypothetical protein